jgi:hypothetical protein
LYKILKLLTGKASLLTIFRWIYRKLARLAQIFDSLFISLAGKNLALGDQDRLLGATVGKTAPVSLLAFIAPPGFGPGLLNHGSPSDGLSARLASGPGKPVIY